MPDADLTELIDIDPERVDLVKSPANGFPILLMKAVNAQGGIDEKPDIDTAEHILQLLAKLIIAEAQEMAAGNFDELCDIDLLTQAAHTIACFKRMEQYGDEDDGESMYKDTLVSKAELEELATYLAKRKVSSAERKRLAEAGHALPDGSYVVENEEDLHNAAILARSGHGDVAAAKRLIAKRAKELGVANPLANDMSKESEVPEQDNIETSPAPEAPEAGKPAETAEKSAAELAEEAVAKAVTPLQEVIKGLEAEMAVLKSTPIPGGPVVTNARPLNESARTQHFAEAARHERLSKSVTDRDLIRYHEEKAAEHRKAAEA